LSYGWKQAEFYHIYTASSYVQYAYSHPRLHSINCKVVS